MTPDEKTMVVGCPTINSNRGCVTVFELEANDTWVEALKLSGYTDNFDNSGQQGTSCAISANAQVIASGAPERNSDTGAVWIFRRTGLIWDAGVMIVPGDATTGAYAGRSCALTDDGNTLAIGGYGNNAVWVFVWNGTNWIEQAKLTPAVTVGNAIFGYSCALSINTLIVGGPYDSSNKGAVWVFTRTGSTWTEQYKLSHTQAVIDNLQGVSCSISASDGNTIAIGAPSVSGDGEVFIFLRNIDNSWTEIPKFTYAKPLNEFVGPDFTLATFGESCSLSDDGRRLVVGAPLCALTSPVQGQVFVWKRVGSSLYVLDYTFRGTGTIGESRLGSSCVVRNSKVVVCGEKDNGEGVSYDNPVGGIWTFRKYGDVWAQFYTKITCNYWGSQGTSVDISGDGQTLAVGNIGNINGNGTVHIYTRTAEGGWAFQADLSPIYSVSPISGGGSFVKLSFNGNSCIAGSNASQGVIVSIRNSDGLWAAGPRIRNGTALQGITCSISGDATTIAFGGYTLNNLQGLIFVYVKQVDGTWIQQGNNLAGLDVQGICEMGYSVALSYLGNVLVFTGPANYGNVGGAWVFVRTNGVWSQAGTRLTGQRNVGACQQGISCAVSSEGSTIAIGAPDDNSGVGAVWVFRFKESIWTQEGERLVGSGAIGNSRQGTSCNLSGCLSAPDPIGFKRIR
jgi:hypothetical protein